MLELLRTTILTEMATKNKLQAKAKVATLGLSSAKGDRSSGKIKGDKVLVYN